MFYPCDQNDFSLNFSFQELRACIFFLFDVSTGPWAVGKQLMQELMGAFPGIDEAVSFAEVMKKDLFSFPNIEI